MSAGRSRRKRKNESVSESWYVGYTEDSESVEAIMKKFEELEQLKQETKENHEGEDGGQELTEAQLEELFKRTSAFTVKSAGMIDDDEIDAVDMFKLEFDQEYYQLISYEIGEDSFWGQSPPKTRKKSDRNQLEKYKGQRIQDSTGNYYVVKKKAIDPSQPSYIRIPLPLQRAWARLIEPFKGNQECPYFRGNIFDFKDKNLGSNYQAILMDPPICLDEDRKPGQITLAEFEKIDIPSLVKSGFLFIWTEKEHIGKFLKIAKKWGFRYVENFCWIKKNLNNTIAAQSSTYFKKSKQGDLELRHQRNPDCEFDFIKPRNEDDLTETKPEFIYDIIETLLPTALCSKERPLPDRLLELWARPFYRRNHWTAFRQTSESVAPRISTENEL